MQNYYFSYERIRNFFDQSLKKNIQCNAYIIYGSHGNGKTYLSNQIAKQLLISNQEYVKHNYLQSPNLYVVDNKLKDGELFISVNLIRNIKSWVKHTIINAKHKVVIIDDIDRMNINAQNSFLKILEEPIGSTIYILNTSHIKSISQTIQSRCIKIKLQKIHLEKFISIIYKVCQQNKTVNFKHLYTLCYGDMNLAIELIKNHHLHSLVVLYSNKKYDSVLDVMSQLNIDDNVQLRLFECLTSKLMSIVITKNINNKLIHLSLVSYLEQVQNILYNIHLLNKQYSQQFIVNNLKQCLLL